MGGKRGMYRYKTGAPLTDRAGRYGDYAEKSGL